LTNKISARSLTLIFVVVWPVVVDHYHDTSLLIAVICSNQCLAHQNSTFCHKILENCLFHIVYS